MTTHRRFDLFEVVLMSAFVGIIGLVAGMHAPGRAPTEGAELARAYGPDRYSRNNEEWIIRDFFRDQRHGVFVDVGANHYRDDSNTYYLERHLGWTGIAVEPLAEFAPGYLEHRPGTRFRAFFVSDVSNSVAKMYLQKGNTLVSSSDRAFTAQMGTDIKEIEVPTITLNDLLDHEGVKTIDFLSMDIELAEPKALAGFDIRRFAPRLVCIEAHPAVRQALLDYFARHGYVAVGDYLRADVYNLYFTPLGVSGTGS